MHPIIRLVSFVTLSLALAVGDWPQLLIGALAAAVLLVRAGATAWSVIVPMMRRMRWLWLSLAVIYLWFTPGTPIVPVPEGWAAWVPTEEGVLLGTMRITALALMVITAGLLLHLTSREQLFAALHWLAAPLGLFGVTRERVAVRVALTLSAVADVRSGMREAVSQFGLLQSRWSRWGDRVANLFRTTVLRAESAPCEEIAIPPQTAPPVWQWVWPIALGAVMYAAGALAR